MIGRGREIVNQLRLFVAVKHDLVLVVLLTFVVLALSAACTPRAPVQPQTLPDGGKGWGTPAFLKMCRDPARHDPELCGELR